jgi:hypothetical protein
MCDVKAGARQALSWTCAGHSGKPHGRSTAIGGRRINNPPQVKQPAPQAGEIRRGARRNEGIVYAADMSKMIQIRDVSEHVHGILKARAAREGMTLSAFIKKELENIAQHPSMREWLDLVQEMTPIPSKRSGAQIVRELRDAR